MKLLPLVLISALAGPALAQDAKPSPSPPPKTEITIYAGASLLDVTSQGVRSFPIPLPISQVLPDLLPEGGVEFRNQVTLGGCALFGFKAARALGSRARLELDFAVAPNHDLETDVEFVCPPGRFCILGGIALPFTARRTVPAYQYGLGVAYDLARGEVRPYLVLGVGGVSYDTPEAVETSFTVTAGAGARLLLGERTGVRIEVVDRIVTDSFVTGSVENDLQVLAGFFVRLP